MGLGYRQWATRTGAEGGYPRTGDSFFLPLGIEARYRPSSTLYVFSGEIAPVISHQTKSYLSNIDPSLPDVEQKGSGGLGTRLSGQAHIPFQERSGIMVEAYYQYWKLDEPEAKQIATNITYKRPVTSSSLFGVAVGATF